MVYMMYPDSKGPILEEKKLATPPDHKTQPDCRHHFFLKENEVILISTLHIQTESHNSLYVFNSLHPSLHRTIFQAFWVGQGEGKGSGVREGAGGERTGQDEMRQTEGRQKTSVPI